MLNTSKIDFLALRRHATYLVLYMMKH